MTHYRPPPMWWTLLRDALMLGVGLGCIIYEHYTPADARPLLIATDLILVGMIPLNHLAARFPRPRLTFDADPPPPPPPPPAQRVSFETPVTRAPRPQPVDGAGEDAR